MSDDEPIRCGWATARSGPDFELYRDYHDREWGQTVRDGVALFERMSLEAFQSGLSWLTILRKRENFRRAFSGFDIDAVAGYTDADVQRLMADPGIVRNRAKIEATIANARAAAELGGATQLAELLWSFAPAPGPGRPTRPKYPRPLPNRRPWPVNSSGAASASSGRPPPMR
ncbi:methyladenine glycosylase family protein [Mycobacterium avium subsp. avium 2285 (R)]|nr:methyladenine glycosylase family protein [Mycobacterium avium subsp. avium 2285 (R)]